MARDTLIRSSMHALATVGQGYLRTPQPANDGPDFATGEFRVVHPPEVRAALESGASDANIAGYPSPRGLDELRQAVLLDLQPSPAVSDLLVTGGGKEAMWIAAQLAVDETVRRRPRPAVVLVPQPGWQPYRIIFHALGATVVGYDPIELARDQRLLLTFEDLAPDIVVLNFPNNPTGAQLTQLQLDAVVTTCRQMGSRVLSDEVYRALGNGSSLSRSSLVEEHDLIVESASKWLAAAGLRVGFLVSGRQNVDSATEFRSTYASGVAEVAQRIALALIEAPACSSWLKGVRAELHETREALADALAALGVSVRSAGGFYLWFRSGELADVPPGPVAGLQNGASFGDGEHWRVCCAREGVLMPEAAESIVRALRVRSDG